MKVTQAGSAKCKKDSVEDILHETQLDSEKMKKFIKSKIDHNETTNRVTPSTSSEASCQISKQERAKPEVQPPLPLDPPPPDKLPNMNLTLKKEIEDIEYQSPSEESSESMNHGLNDNKPSDGEETEKSRPMCRDFIRGKCMRPGTCKFSHKCDISQLFGVYTFCRNFQNSVCTLPNCKYVHASVFEEQHFYRTAELPPHALAHHKKVNILPPPPPPPEDVPAPMQSIFNTPPPPLPFSIERPPPVISCIPASKMEVRTLPEKRDNIAPGPSSVKRTWGVENFPSTSRDIEPDTDRFPKRCRNCEYMELRKEFMKEKCEKLKKAKLEAHKNLELLNKKRERLYGTLMTLFKPTWLQDQMSNVINSNMMTGIHEDTRRSNMNGGTSNLSSLVAKLLSVYRQHILTTDPSRKT
ncbi:uncharacterized protein [Battus philenor]|uniref:uncharacterized protein isoform X2 n=1 Tax=Battus philenor TaxID=42288 RepID=UPI0035D0F0A0